MAMTNNPAALARAQYDRLVFQRGAAAVNTEAVVAAFAAATAAVVARAAELQGMTDAAAAERAPS